MYEIVIIGAGTAGLTAAVYGCRAGRRVLLLEENIYGGQIVNAAEVENYPGIPQISGFEFAENLYRQATELGAEFRYEKVHKIEVQGKEKTVVTNRQKYTAKAVILATGAKNRHLGIAREEELIGKGVSYCAACDGAFYRGRDVAVVGGGNTALEDAQFFSRNLQKCVSDSQKETFPGEDRLLQKLRKKENVHLVLDSEVVGLEGEERLAFVAVRRTDTKEEQILPVAGLFIAIGQIPDNHAFSSLVNLDENGYIQALEDCRTSAEGIFAAGDCRTKEVRQLATAAADGAVAALAACRAEDDV